MGRSAYLPDDRTLSSLLARAAAPSASSDTRSEPLASSAQGQAMASGLDAPESSSSDAAERNAFSGARPVPPSLRHGLDEAQGLVQRFSVLADWLARDLSASSVFIVDADGLSMTEQPIADGYAAAAGTLGSTLDTVGALLPDIARTSTWLELASGEHLALICSPTELGRLTVGVVSSTPIVDFRLEVVVPALCAATDARSPSEHPKIEASNP